jgi:hypothetical protein
MDPVSCRSATLQGRTMNPRVCLRVVIVAALLLPAGFTRAAAVPASFITSWNVCSKQFIDAPVFRVLPLAPTAQYRAIVRQDNRSWSLSARAPSLSLEEIWPLMRVGEFTLMLDCVDREGKVLRSETSTRFKAPDFQGFNEPAADWAAAADRNIAYLINANDHLVVPYREPGVPVWIWAATPGHKNSYPCITINNLTWAFLAHRENHGPQSAEALRLARAGADWALEHRHPNSGALPLFPYSTISKGKFGGSVDGEAVNLLRASWLAISFVDLYEATRHQPYLDYARHIADTTVRFQNADGSFPYRVNPLTGAVIEQYNCSAMEFVELVEKLDPFGHNQRRELGAQRALDWMLFSVCTTRNWKAAYEDVGEKRLYFNLSQMPVLPLIRYLCRHQDEDPAYLRTAMELNRWVEDQFIAFGPDNASSPVRVKGPQVFEQFVCWRPMEGHTASWILALIELHRATGQPIYLEKARAAANAICAEQYPDGQFSTWGRDHQTGIAFIDDEDPPRRNWFNGNAFADWALYKLTLYVKTLKQ